MTTPSTKIQGTTVAIDNSLGVPVTIGKLTGISWGGSPRTKIDVSVFASTIVEYLAGRLKAGTFTLDVLMDLDDTGQIEVESARLAMAIRDFKIVVAEGTITDVDFTASVIDNTQAGKNEDVWRRKITCSFATRPVRS